MWCGVGVWVRYLRCERVKDDYVDILKVINQRMQICQLLSATVVVSAEFSLLLKGVESVYHGSAIALYR
jgi:hypothetical protein